MKKILKLGARLSVIDGDDVEIMDALPPAVYSMKFSKMQGFWFEPMQLEPFSGKVYGEQIRMAEKVERRYRAVEGRNLGVLLSGPKGTGKSLFVRNLAAKLSAEMPVVVVKENGGQPMLSELASLKGRAVIVFDEFEKMFRADATGSSGCSTRENDIREQEVVGFTQEPPEDVNDNPVPDAPAITGIIVQRRSAMEAVNASRYARGDRLSLML